MSLSGRTVVVLAFPDYHELEFWYPVLRAREEDADVRIVATSEAGVESHLGYPVIPDTDAADLVPADVDAVVVPGAVNGLPELSAPQWDLLRAVAAAGGLVASIGTGAKLLSQEDLVGSENVAGQTTDELPELFRELIAAVGKRG
ncbi:MAG: DJ-1/PfpI family protein [Kibdelosporangium sp.]